MSRLRRLVLSNRFFFLIIKLLPKQRPLDEWELALLARCLSVVRSRCQFQMRAWEGKAAEPRAGVALPLPDHWHVILFPPYPLTSRFLLTVWVFLPDHWHAIFYPPFPLTISRIMESIRDRATKRINSRRRECGTLFQPRLF